MDKLYGLNDIYPGANSDPTPTQAASGPVDKASARPAFYWAGFLALLIVARILYEKAK